MTKEETISRIQRALLVPNRLQGLVLIDEESANMAIEALSAEAVQGEWKHTITWQPYCSNCEYVFGEDEEFSPFWKYCPMCGAKMKGGDSE